MLGGSAGQVLYQSALNTTSFVPTGPTGSVFTASGTNAPTWTAQASLSVGSATTATTSTNIAAGLIGQIPYQSAAGTTTYLPTGPTGSVFTANGAAAPTWTNLDPTLTALLLMGA